MSMAGTLTVVRSLIVKSEIGAKIRKSSWAA